MIEIRMKSGITQQLYEVDKKYFEKFIDSLENDGEFICFGKDTLIRKSEIISVKYR